MKKTNQKSLNSILIQQLEEKVQPALGCTEPVSVALAAAKAASMIKEPVDHVEAWVSPNLMKNGMGVTIPGTGMTGLSVAAALGATGGNPDGGLEVLSSITPDTIEKAKQLVSKGKISVQIKHPCSDVLYAEVKVCSKKSHAVVSIAGEHTRVVYCECNQHAIYDIQSAVLPLVAEHENPFAGTTLEDIYQFSLDVPLAKISFLSDAVKLNDALSRTGIDGNWGLSVGRSMAIQQAENLIGDDLLTRIMIRTAAASDARMGGAPVPAMSNSGSGNQGITATLPVLVVAEHIQASEEMLLRALSLSHLTAIYIHSFFPPLSALCAAGTAAMGAAAGMAWLLGRDFATVSMAINNMIGDISGMLCDGASGSCAMKVSTSVAAAYKAVLMALQKQYVTGTDGIVCHNTDESIANLGALASGAMQYTDTQIIKIMNNKFASPHH